jgi:hypothetical protein
MVITQGNHVNVTWPTDQPSVTTLVLEVDGDGGCDGEDGARGPRSAATQVWVPLRRVPLLISPYPYPIAIELSSFLLSLNPRRLLSTAGFDIRSRFPL